MKKRKIKLKFKFKVLLFIIITVLLLFIFFKKDETKEPVIIKKNDFVNNITFNKDYSSTDFINVENKVIDVLNLLYKSMYYLEENDFSKLIKDDTESYLTNKIVKYLVETRKNERNDLSLTNTSYDIEFKSIENIENDYIVTVMENGTYNFKFMKEVSSYYYNIQNIFTFDESYNLISFKRSADSFSLFDEFLEEDYTLEEIDLVYEELYNKKIISIEDNKLLYQEFLESEKPEYKTCDNDYNREKALSYASKYVKKRNTKEWEKYDEYGGNCQNFASQVLFSGGIPMDVYGKDIWKWYSNEPDNSEDKYGRSPSWTIVNEFYIYAKNNIDFGLCAETNLNIYYAEEGDIIQVGYDGIFIHSTVSIKPYKNNNDKVIEILVNSNTNDYENYPISAISTPEVRLIKILGFND